MTARNLGILLAVVSCVIVFQFAVAAEPRVDVGVSIGEEGLKGFYLSVGEHYGTTEKEVLVVKKRRIPDEEIPVVFFIAKRASVPAEKIVELRLGGKSWMEISLQFGIHADAFYVPVETVSGPPYGKAYGYYKKKPRSEWKTITLQDDDVVNLVNLRFISETHGCSPDEIVKMKSEGESFVAIDNEARNSKAGKGKAVENDKGKNAQDDSKNSSKGKGGEGKGKGRKGR